MKKVVFCWSNISGYMAACWRALAAQGVSFHVLAYSDSRETAFDSSLMDGVSWTALSTSQRLDRKLIEELVSQQQPDAVVLSGWLNKAYTQLVHSKHLHGCKFIMGMDTPWKGSTRQHLASIVLRNYLRKISAVWVTGERAWEYARHLGFSAGQIHKGLYGVDHAGLRLVHETRARESWPKSFLFMGRLHQEKGVDLLVDAYQKYASHHREAWPLVVAGQGPLAGLVAGTPGVEYVGFQQPAECRELLRNAGVFVMPSRYDPWPLAVVEAAASGLPILASYKCGSTVEVVRSYYNGIVTDVSAVSIAKAMEYFHENNDQLPGMGQRGVGMSECYSAELWCDRLTGVLRVGG